MLSLIIHVGQRAKRTLSDAQLSKNDDHTTNLAISGNVTLYKPENDLVPKKHHHYLDTAVSKRDESSISLIPYSKWRNMNDISSIGSVITALPIYHYTLYSSLAS